MSREVHKDSWHPEPWRTNVESSDVDEYNFVYVSCDDSMCLWTGDATYDKDMATAHLNSAAPDMYEALNRICNKLLISDRDGESHISEKDGEMALVALRKARGEA